MTACPSINQTWKAVYAPIASQDMYITNLAFLDYLCRIAQFQKSIIYHDFIPRLTRTITCFVDLRENENEETAKEAYRYVVALPNLLGFQALFPLVPYISFKIAWVCIGEDIYLPPFRGGLIRARYDRFLSSAFSDCPRGKTKMNLYITMNDLDHSAVKAWSDIFCKLSDVGFPGFFFLSNSSPSPFEMSVVDGVRHVRETSYIVEGNLEDYDPRNINKRLWMASNKRHST